MTDLSSYLPCGDMSPNENLPHGQFLHMTICQVEKFLHVADFSGACDKYEVWFRGHTFEGATPNV